MSAGKRGKIMRWNRIAQTALLVALSVLMAAPAGSLLGAPASHASASTPIVFERASPFVSTFGPRPDNNSTPPPPSGAIAVGESPDALALDASLGELFVANFASSDVSVVNTTTDAVNTSISNVSNSLGLALDPSSGYLFAPELTPCCPSEVAVIDAATDRVVASVPLGAVNPWAALYDPRDGDVYVSNADGGTVSMLNGSSPRLLTSIPVGTGGNPVGMAFDPANDQIYVANLGAGNVTLINGTTNRTDGELVAPANNTPVAVAVGGADGYIYVAERGGGGDEFSPGNVSVFNATTGALVTNIPVGTDPEAIVADPVNGNLYVAVDAAYGSQNFSTGIVGFVTEISGRTNSVIGSFAVGNHPSALAFDAANNRLYVANGGSSSVSVVPGNSTAYPVRVQETGLPIGTPWYVNLPDRESYRSQTGSATFYEPNGTYDLEARSSEALYVAHATLTVQGGPATVNVTFVPNPDVISFVESGLPNGTRWVVELTREGANRSTEFLNTTQNTIEFVESNGTFAYGIVAFAQYLPSPENGTVTLNGTPITVNVRFSEITYYTVTFTETGLPSGWLWSVRFGYTQAETNAPTMQFEVTNGTYSYGFGNLTGAWGGSYPAWDETQLPMSGSVTVAGASVSEPTIHISVLVEVMYDEFGLPPGTSWSVYLNGTNESGSFTTVETSSGWLWLVPGKYDYKVGKIAGYQQSTIPGSGTIDLTLTNGGNGTPYHIEPTLDYARVTYLVTITETGLPSGERFVGTVDGVRKALTTTGGSDTLTWSGLANGTYAYSIGDISGWHQTSVAYSGNLTVSGGSAPSDGQGVGSATELTFSEVTYEVVFAEVGLPAGTGWGVTFGGTQETGTAEADTNLNILVFNVPNGTYAFSVQNVPGWHQSTDGYAGSIAVEGSYRQIPSLYFTEVTYPVAFTESGLPVGTDWSVTVGTTVLTSNAQTIQFELPNGTAFYSVGSVHGYNAKSGPGEFNVDGAGSSVAITYSRVPSPLAPAWVLPAVGGLAIGAVVAGLGVYALTRRRVSPGTSAPASTGGGGKS